MSNQASPSNLRIGDAERAEMSDILGKHYSDGRLDEQEFRERMERAMAAKTQADLHGLLSDLPPLGPAPSSPLGSGPGAPAPAPAPCRPVRRRGRMFQLAVIIALAFVVANLVTAPWPFFFHPWPLVALFVVAALILRRRRHYHHHHHP